MNIVKISLKDLYESYESLAFAGGSDPYICHTIYDMIVASLNAQDAYEPIMYKTITKIGDQFREQWFSKILKENVRDDGNTSTVITSWIKNSHNKFNWFKFDFNCQLVFSRRLSILKVAFEKNPDVEFLFELPKPVNETDEFE